MANPPERPTKQKPQRVVEDQDPTTELIDIITLRNNYAENFINDKIEYLIDQGANLNGTDQDHIPLHLAIAKNKHNMVRILLGFGANINIRNSNGDTPILYSLEYNAFNCFFLLLELGANCRLQNNLGVSVLMHYAMRLQHHDSLLFKDGTNGITHDCHRMIQLGANVNATNAIGQTALLLACTPNTNINANTVCFIEKILEYGADVNIMDQHGNSSIAFIYNRVMTSEQVPFCINIAKMLVDKGAYVNARDQTGRCALERACTQPNISDYDVFEMIKSLFYTPHPYDPIRVDVNIEHISLLLQENGHGAIIEVVIEYIKQITQNWSIGVSSVLKEGLGIYDPEFTVDLHEFMYKKNGGKKKTKRRKNKKRKTQRRK